MGEQDPGPLLLLSETEAAHQWEKWGGSGVTELWEGILASRLPHFKHSLPFCA